MGKAEIDLRIKTVEQMPEDVRLDVGKFAR